MNPSSTACKICQNSIDNRFYSFRENMFESDQEFRYMECCVCKCLQLYDVPNDLAKYYPKEYSNFAKARFREKHSILRYLRKKKSEYQLGLTRNIPGMLMNWLSEPGFVPKLAPANLPLNASILDLGAGNGERLLRLSQSGFTRLLGIDPFIEEDIRFANGLEIQKKGLDDLHEKFDFIMLNHSFEHMPDPRNVLEKLNGLISSGKYILIRIPVADSYAYRHYGENWVALDPPRHFFLHTHESIQTLASQTGFTVEATLDDSIEYQFVGSEQLLKGIKLRSENSYYVNPERSIFTNKDINKFRRKAKQLNKDGQGDARCFYLKKM
jgi:SAM-dependent methyltransferase